MNKQFQVRLEPMFIYFSQGLILGSTAASQPGPFQAYLLSQTLRNGWRKTLLAAFAPLLSDGPIILLVLLVLSNTPELFLNGLQVMGGFFLIFLAWKAYLHRRTNVQLPEDAISGTAVGKQNIFEAAMMNALSPGPYIFWATIAGPILIAGWKESAGHGLSFLLGFYGTLIGGFIAFITLFALAKRLDPRINNLLSILSAIILFAFGLYQIWQGGMALGSQIG